MGSRCVLSGWFVLVASSVSLMAQPPLHTIQYIAVSNLAAGNAVNVAVDRHDGGMTTTGAVRMTNTGGNDWMARVAVRGSVTTTNVQSRFMARTTSSATYCTEGNGNLSGTLSTHTVPLWEPGYTGKTVHYVTTWTNVSIHYRIDGSEDWETSPHMERVGQGRTVDEHRYVIHGIGVAGRPLEFVMRGSLGANTNLWDNATLGGVGSFNNNYMTWLDEFYLQDKHIFNYEPPATLSAPQIVSVTSWSSSYTGNGIPTRGGRIYLPRGYTQNTSKQYPVLYMHDGQNVFDPGGAFGSWSTEVAVNGEIAQGRMRETIIVAVNNTGSRMSEYGTPQDGYTGDYYVKYLVHNVKPSIDSGYRTLTNFMDTGVMGSSLGGLISAYAGLSTNVFGLVGAVSPSYWYGPNFRSWIQNNNTKGNRIYQDAGTAEGSSMWDYFWPVYGYYLQDGYVVGDDLYISIGCGQGHNEAAWASRVGGALRYLFNIWDEPNLLTTNNIPEPPPEPFLAITNPVSPATVGPEVDAIDVSGVAENIDGDLFWTNTVTGAGGSFAAADSWSLPGIALGVGTNVITVRHQWSETAPDIILAEDHRANYTSWTTGHNEGEGFEPWTLNANGTAGHFLGANGFGFWTHEGGNLSEALRPFTDALSPGQTFRVNMRNGWIWESGGSVGVALRNVGGDTLWEFYFNGGDTYYSITGHTTDVAWTDAGLDIAFTLTGETTYEVIVTPSGGSPRFFSGSLANGPVTEFRAWSFNNGTNDEFNPNRDYFVNHLAITVPGPEDGVWISDSVTVTREADEDIDTNGDGVPDWWYQGHGLDPTVPDQAAQAGPNGHTYGDSYVLGLDPNDPASTFKFDALGFTFGTLTMTWGAMDNRRYILQHTPNLHQPFQDVLDSEVDIPLNGGTRHEEEHDAETSGGTGFYRLRFLETL